MRNPPGFFLVQKVLLSCQLERHNDGPRPFRPAGATLSPPTPAALLYHQKKLILPLITQS